jgi:hypothetical protein
VALKLLERHLWPIALYPPGVEIQSKGGRKVTTGKEPIGRDWGRRQPTAADLIETYQAHPGAGVGVRLGLDGGVIDIEVDAPDGWESLERLIGRSPETMGWSSRRGPHHLFRFEYRFLRLKRSVLKLPEFPGLEIRLGANGSQLQSACPPTIGEDGPPRLWNGHDWIARLPEPAIEQLLTLAMKPAPTPVREAIRPAADCSAYGAEALASECDLIARTGEGQRHNTLRSAALRIASLAKAGALEWENGRRQLAEAAAGRGLPESEVRELLEFAWMHADPRPRLIHMVFRSGCPPQPKDSDICIKTSLPGASLERAKVRIPGVDVPDELVDNRNLEPIARAMIALAEEATRRGEATFHAPYRLIGDLAGVRSPMTVLQRLGALSELGYVSLVEPGIPGTGPTGKANTWAWHDPPGPGKTVWNSMGRPSGSKRSSGRRDPDNLATSSPAGTEDS